MSLVKSCIVKKFFKIFLLIIFTFINTINFSFGASRNTLSGTSNKKILKVVGNKNLKVVGNKKINTAKKTNAAKFQLVKLNTAKKTKIKTLNLKKSSSNIFKTAINNKHLSLNNNKSQIQPGKIELLVDLNTGEILHEKNSNEQFLPASLAKVMTAYLTFKAIKQKKISLNTKITVPKNLPKVPNFKMNLKPGDKITVRDAIHGTIISSANDAAETLILHLAKLYKKDLHKFMTAEAKKLGMRNTTFYNASGLHNDKQKTTAKDLMKLTFGIRHHFPDMYKIFSKTSYEYNGKTYKGHNYITAKYDGAEGLKTGFTAKSGYNLISVVTRGGQTVAAIVAGSKSRISRDKRMLVLLDRYFNTKSEPDLVHNL